MFATKIPDGMSIIGITGITGGIGTALSQSLISAGFAVRGLARNESKITDLLRTGGADIFYGDVLDPATTVDFVSGCTAVVHLAASHGDASMSDQQIYDANVIGAGNVARACHVSGVTRMVHISSIGVHGEAHNGEHHEDSPFAPVGSYPTSKLKGELAVRQLSKQTGLELVVLRPLGIFGPGDMRFLKLFRGLKNRVFPVVGPCDSLIQFCYIDTFCAAVRAALDSTRMVGEVYIVGDTTRLSVRQFIDQAALAVGGAPFPLPIPLLPLKFLAILISETCRPFGVNPILHPRRLEFYTSCRTASVEKINLIIGEHRPLGFPEMLVRTANWYRSQGHL